MEETTIFLIIFFIIFFIIIIFVLIYNISSSSSFSVKLLTENEDDITNKGMLENLEYLDPFTINNYVQRSEDLVGIKFLKTGYYNFQINFSLSRQGLKGTDNQVYLFISYTSSAVLSVYYDNVYEKVNGPTYLYNNQTSYNERNDNLPTLNEGLQKGEENVGDAMCPLSLFVYPCKTNNNGDCYSNYYTVTGVIKVDDLNQIYYIQNACDGNSNGLEGNGNIFFQYN